MTHFRVSREDWDLRHRDTLAKTIPDGHYLHKWIVHRKVVDIYTRPKSMKPQLNDAKILEVLEGTAKEITARIEKGEFNKPTLKRMLILESKEGDRKTVKRAIKAETK